VSSLTPEGKVKRKVTAMLKRNGIWYFFPASNGMGRAGIPDIIAIIAGMFVGIETKADKTKKPTQLQSICGQQIKAAGGQWFLVFDDDTTAELESFVKARLEAAAQDASS